MQYPPLLIDPLRWALLAGAVLFWLYLAVNAHHRLTLKDLARPHWNLAVLLGLT